MKIQFTKMQGLGNDFIVIDGIRQSIHLTPHEIASLSRRDIGIGFDQCLLVEASPDPTIDFFYRIFNANGEEVGQCGNGARCLARFVQAYELTRKSILRIATHTTVMQLQIHTNDTVTVEMQQPQFLPEAIPFNVAHQQQIYTITCNTNEQYAVHALNVGNPHAIMIVDDLSQTPVHDIGRKICEHASFPEQTNVGFMQINTQNKVNLRVYERGAAETRACGSGAVAAMAAGRMFHALTETVTVSQAGGDLVVYWPDINGPIYQTGPAVLVYEGQIDLANFKI